MANIISSLANSVLVLLFTMLKSFIKSTQDIATKALYGWETTTAKKSFYELVDKDMNGKSVNFNSFKDSIVLVVNVASK